MFSSFALNEQGSSFEFQGHFSILISRMRVLFLFFELSLNVTKTQAQAQDEIALHVPEEKRPNT